MNKDEFFKSLDESLKNFYWQEKKDIMYDYEEHFRIGLQNARTEEELVAELGNPKDIAAQYRLSLNPEKLVDEDMNNAPKDTSKLENTSISIIAAIALLVFNLIFILGPYLGLAGGLIGLFAGAIGAFFGGIALIFSTLFGPLVNDVSGLLINVSPAASMLFGIGTTALGALFFIGDCFIAKYFIKATAKYISWNISIIRR